MTALPLRRLWWRIEDRLPPRREWPAMVASLALLILLAVEVLRPDLVWRVFV